LHQQKANIMEELKGKRVVIPGGSSGIGLAIATAVTARGAEAIIISSNQQRIDQALSTLPAGNKGFAVNLTDEGQVSKIFAAIGPFDHLVYTAGEALLLSSIKDAEVAAAKQFFNVRYWGAFTAVKYAAPHIRAGGSITLTGGVASSRPGKGWSLGASICAAMEGFTRAMAVELAPIRVNTVSPGIVKTSLWANMADTAREGMYSHYSDQLPVGYVAGPEDIAQTYLYLMQQKYSTGQIIVTDGGYALI
jgi:NAD(P)-dependent dehydrogenase (short-subunit alcohol dehydrogenase family)